MLHHGLWQTPSGRCRRAHQHTVHQSVLASVPAKRRGTLPTAGEAAKAGEHQAATTPDPWVEDQTVSYSEATIVSL